MVRFFSKVCRRGNIAKKVANSLKVVIGHRCDTFSALECYEVFSVYNVLAFY